MRSSSSSGVASRCGVTELYITGRSHSAITQRRHHAADDHERERPLGFAADARWTPPSAAARRSASSEAISTGRTRSAAPSTSAGMSASPRRRRASAALSTSRPMSETCPSSAMKPTAALTDSATPAKSSANAPPVSANGDGQQDGERAAPRVHRGVEQDRHGEHRQRHHDLQPGASRAAGSRTRRPTRSSGPRAAARCWLDRRDGIVHHRAHVAPLDVELQREVAGCCPRG